MTDDELGDLIRQLGPESVPLPRPDPRQGPAAMPGRSYRDMYNMDYSPEEIMDLLGSSVDENQPYDQRDPRLIQRPFRR